MAYIGGKMFKQHLFVNIMMLLQCGAIYTYLSQKNWGLAVYWLCCLGINFVVTYVLGK